MTSRKEAGVSKETQKLRKVLGKKGERPETTLRTYASIQYDKIRDKSLKKKLISETGQAIQDFLPYHILRNSDKMFSGMGIKELNMLIELLGEIDHGDQANERIRPAYHSISGAIGILKAKVKP